VRWDVSAPPSGLVFDVARAVGTGSYTRWLTGTTLSGSSFTTTRRRTVWHLHARLRRASDPAAATGWSPDVSIVAR
jgi:hypothetical protein